MRLRRIRFKDGRTLDVLRPRVDREAVRVRDALAASSDLCIETMQPSGIVGYALVAWARNGEVFCAYENGDHSTVPAGFVPQYVHDVLLGEVAVRWSQD